MKQQSILHKKHCEEGPSCTTAERTIARSQEFIPHHLFPEDLNNTNSFDYSVKRQVQELAPNRNSERYLKKSYDKMADLYLSEDAEFSSLYGQSGQLNYLDIRQMLLDEYTPGKKLMLLSLIDTAHFYYRRRQCRKLLMDPDIKQKERTHLMSEVKNLTRQISILTKQLSEHKKTSTHLPLSTEPWLLTYDRKTINS